MGWETDVGDGWWWWCWRKEDGDEAMKGLSAAAALAVINRVAGQRLGMPCSATAIKFFFH